MELTHLSLFSGIGGLDLAAEWAGFKTVGQCEWADFPTKVLEKHWPDVPRWRDIRTLTKENFNERTGLHTVDIVSGGFPCQPFSVAGNRKGEEDDRYLWPEMCRVISEIKPTWVLGENVAGIVNMALDTVLSDLEDIGYETQPFLIPACGVDAPHRRYRVFIVAHSNHSRSRTSRSGIDQNREKVIGERKQPLSQFSGYGQNVAYAECCRFNRFKRRGATQQLKDSCKNVANTDSEGFKAGGCEKPAGISKFGGYSENVSDTTSQRLPGPGEPIKSMHTETDREWKAGKPFDVCIGEQWAVEPELGRVANGISNRVDRLEGLGNAVVPQQAYPIFKAIAEIELGN